MGDLLSSLIGEGVVVAWHDFRAGTFVDLTGNGYDCTSRSDVSFGRDGLRYTGPGGGVVGSYCRTAINAALAPASGSVVWCGRIDSSMGFSARLISISIDNNNRLEITTNAGSDQILHVCKSNGSTKWTRTGSATLLGDYTTAITTWDASSADFYLGGTADGSSNAGDKTIAFASAPYLHYCTDKDREFSPLGSLGCGLVLSRALTAGEVTTLHAELVS